MDSKSRFSSRVENYVRYRPGYPAELAATLQAECGLSAASRVADVGSGTGLLALPFLRGGCRVIGVEPNAEMRAAGDRLLAEYPNFSSRAASAEATGLEGHSVDFITAGQAFHWFDRILAREEFERILAPGGWVVLVWNERRVDTTPFLRAYEQLLLDFGTDYQQVDHRNVDEAVIREFFGHSSLHSRVFENIQWFDLEGVRGRLLSSSYVPEAGAPGYAEMLAELERIFQRYAQDDRVAFAYDTRLFFDRLA
ncbi:MAG TPA: class I SAM-dependent methyltransferase [Anaerolinea sp.]|nr:class I SAM-dependent methyltransferase [Anaerolinea sp.]